MKFTLLGIAVFCCAGYALYRVLKSDEMNGPPMQTVETELLDGPFLLQWYNAHQSQYLQKPAVVPVLIDPTGVGNPGLAAAVAACSHHGADGWKVYVQAFYDQTSQAVLRAQIVRFQAVEARLYQMLQKQEFDRLGIAVIQTAPTDACEI